MSIVPLNIGSASNDGNGQDLRSGGQVINANFAELDQRTTAAQSAADAAQAKADTAQAKADAAIPSLQKGQPNGVAGLDGSGTVPASQLPSYVDDVLEFGSFAALPAAGETGKIYITTDTNSQYRWSGTQYVLLTASPGSTDAVPEGAVNKYWTLARTLGSVITGLVTTNPAVIAATDTVLSAFGKLQRQINDLALIKANKGANSDITSITGLTTPLAIDQGGTGSASGVPEMVGASASAAGTKGLVPAPAAGATRFLSSLGTWLAINTSASWGSIAGTLAAQNDLQTALDAKLDASLVGFTYIYPNGGTQAAPANIVVNTRYVSSNPFPGHEVICQAEILVGGVWGAAGWAYINGSNVQGVSCHQHGDGTIITTTAYTYLTNEGRLVGGGSFASGNPTSAPCRVRVWRIKQ